MDTGMVGRPMDVGIPEAYPMKALWQNGGQPEAPSTPAVYQPILVHGETLRIYVVKDGKAVTEDDAGMRFSYAVDRLAWDGAAGAWRVVR